MSMKSGIVMDRFYAKERAKQSFDAACDDYANALGESHGPQSARVTAAKQKLDHAEAAWLAAKESWLEALR